MLQNAMFFVLGGFVAGLVSLWFMPFVWRRASRITQRRIEASMPLSLPEIQAEKDQMRAEFAVEVRRIEMKSEDLEAKAAEDLVAINTQRERIASIQADRRQKKQQIVEAEATIEDLKAQNARQLERVAQLKADLTSADAKLESRRERILDLEDASRRLDDQLNATRIEVAASQTNFDALKDKSMRAIQMRDGYKKQIAEMRLDSKRLNAQFTKQQKAHAAAILQADESTARLADLQDRLERREREIARLTGGASAKNTKTKPAAATETAPAATKTKSQKAKARKTARVVPQTDKTAATGDSELSNRLVQLAGQKKPAQAGKNANNSNAKAATKTKKTAGSNGIATAMPDVSAETQSGIKSERALLEARVKQLEVEISKKISDNGDRPLRDERLLNDLNAVAAEIAALTARSEGAGSPVLKLLDDEDASDNLNSGQKLLGFKSKSNQSSAQTLTDRIAALTMRQAGE